MHSRASGKVTGAMMDRLSSTGPGRGNGSSSQASPSTQATNNGFRRVLLTSGFNFSRAAAPMFRLITANVLTTGTSTARNRLAMVSPASPNR